MGKATIWAPARYSTPTHPFLRARAHYYYYYLDVFKLSFHSLHKHFRPLSLTLCHKTSRLFCLSASPSAARRAVRPPHQKGHKESGGGRKPRQKLSNKPSRGQAALSEGADHRGRGATCGLLTVKFLTLPLRSLFAALPCALGGLCLLHRSAAASAGPPPARARVPIRTCTRAGNVQKRYLQKKKKKPTNMQPTTGGSVWLLRSLFAFQLCEMIKAEKWTP